MENHLLQVIKYIYKNGLLNLDLIQQYVCVCSVFLENNYTTLTAQNLPE